MNNYHVLYSTFRRRFAEKYMSDHNFPNMVLWVNGSGEWQVRVYSEAQQDCVTS